MGRLYHKEKITVTDLAKRFMVSLPTIYNMLKETPIEAFVL
ncbi:hypothetical protein GQ592_01955 [Gilliamella sp. Lep-s21]|nr:hypothetical protein [Gilliamella sp. Lep-s35]MWP68356.1 hypothetical protein [Gilliamella sp. Lep-s5]MWP76505.1 hypothetical protein [Gilliamella sp. Lep-s21]